MRILYPSLITGSQKKKEGTAYRLMHYVVQQEVEEGVLLYNTLTCAMVLVTHEETKNLTAVEGLIEHYFLVPVDHDDKKFCKIIKFGFKMMQPRIKGIRKYTVVTTTGCNARCAYCFEKGTKPVNMTMETAEKVAQYIITHRGEHEEVQIDWFGGEPLYNYKVMDHICTRLQESNVKFFSRVISNGYLFSDRFVDKACQLWNLKRVQVTLDGTEENYNRIKAYVHNNGTSPYQRVMDNIKRLLEAKIPTIQIRIHLSYEILEDIWALAKECGERFQGYDNCYIYFRPLYEHVSTEVDRTSLQRKALYEETIKLNNFVQTLGIKGHPLNYKKNGLPVYQCMVDSEDAVMIVPDGHLGLCELYLESRFFGHIDNDEWDLEVIKQSREYWEEIPECDTCAYYPRCYRLKTCIMRKDCFKEVRDYYIASIRNRMLRDYNELRKETNIIQ